MRLIIHDKTTVDAAKILLHLKHSLDFSKKDKEILRKLVHKYDVKPNKIDKNLPWILSDKPFQLNIKISRD